MNEELAAELARMAADDQRARDKASGGSHRPGPAVSQEGVAEMRRVDARNTRRLREILDEHGWPGRSLVGDEGVQHAWLIAQHADDDVEFQRRALALLTEAVAADDAPASLVAYLTDRVRMHEGQGQLYGTQIMDLREDEVVPFAIDDPAGLDHRRAQVGLPPFACYAERVKKLLASERDR